MLSILRFTQTIPIPEPTKNPHPYLNDATGGGGSDYGAMGDIAGQVADGIQSGLANSIVWLIEKLTPLVIFGCKMTIAGCIVVYFCSKDRRCITAGVRALVIMIIFLLLNWYVHL